MNNLYTMKSKAIWDYLKTQDALYWLINIYFFLEYVRPQTINPSIDVFPFTQTVILLTLALYFGRNGIHWFKSPANPLMILFLAAILASSFFALNSTIAFDKVPEFISWMIVYFLICNIVNTKERFLVFMLAFLLYSFKMAQFSFRGWARIGFGFSDWGTGGGPGWFHNSGEFGIQMCVFLPLAAYFFVALKGFWPLWKKALFLMFPFMGLTGTISCSSRGALMGAGAVLLWMLLKSHYKVKGLLVVGLTAWLILSLLPPEQKARFQEAGNDRTSITRMERWNKGLEMAKRYPFFGVGLNNWIYADRVIFGENGGLSHNIFIQCMSELGYTGLGVFVLMILVTFYINYQTRRLDPSKGLVFYMAHGLDGALVGFLVSGFFITVLYYPYFWINLAMTVALNNAAKNGSAQLPRNVKSGIEERI